MHDLAAILKVNTAAMTEAVGAIRELKETTYTLRIGQDWGAGRCSEVGGRHRNVMVCWKRGQPGHVPTRCGNINLQSYFG